MSDLTDDTSPQLGGDLDVNGQDIVSTSNADIDIIPNGTGDVNLGADTVQVGDNNADATITTQGTGDLILNTNNGTNAGNITLADGSTISNTYTNNAGEVPDGSVSWCFGSTSTHASSNAQCTAANTTGSTTWANNANADHFQIIYALPTSYTVGPVSPKFTVKVGESKTLDVAIYPENSSGKCNFQPGNPIFTFSLSE